MKADYVHKDTLTATDYVDLQKENDLIVSYNQQLLKENQQLKIQISAREEEYRKLENNWNELKNIIRQDIKQSEQLIEECPRELRNTIVGTRNYETIVEYNKYILSKMQELEKGKSE